VNEGQKQRIDSVSHVCGVASDRNPLLVEPLGPEQGGGPCSLRRSRGCNATFANMQSCSCELVPSFDPPSVSGVKPVTKDGPHRPLHRERLNVDDYLSMGRLQYFACVLCIVWARVRVFEGFVVRFIYFGS